MQHTCFDVNLDEIRKKHCDFTYSSPFDNSLAGVYSGIFAGAVMCPIEHVKCRFEIIICDYYVFLIYLRENMAPSDSRPPASQWALWPWPGVCWRARGPPPSSGAYSPLSPGRCRVRQQLLFFMRENVSENTYFKAAEYFSPATTLPRPCSAGRTRGGRERS